MSKQAEHDLISKFITSYSSYIELQLQDFFVVNLHVLPSTEATKNQCTGRCLAGISHRSVSVETARPHA